MREGHVHILYTVNPHVVLTVLCVCIVYRFDSYDQVVVTLGLCDGQPSHLAVDQTRNIFNWPCKHVVTTIVMLTEAAVGFARSVAELNSGVGMSTLYGNEERSTV